LHTWRFESVWKIMNYLCDLWGRFICTCKGTLSTIWDTWILGLI